MQAFDLGIAFIIQGIATVLAVSSVIVAIYLGMKGNEKPSMKIRTIQWISFVIGVTILQVYSGISMMSLGHYLEVTGIVISIVCLGISGWLSLYN